MWSRFENVKANPSDSEEDELDEEEELNDDAEELQQLQRQRLQQGSAELNPPPSPSAHASSSDHSDEEGDSKVKGRRFSKRPRTALDRERNDARTSQRQYYPSYPTFPTTGQIDPASQTSQSQQQAISGITSAQQMPSGLTAQAMAPNMPSQPGTLTLPHSQPIYYPQQIFYNQQPYFPGSQPVVHVAPQVDTSQASSPYVNQQLLFQHRVIMQQQQQQMQHQQQQMLHQQQQNMYEMQTKQQMSAEEHIERPGGQRIKSFGVFVLHEQASTRQRKAVKSEVRYLIPNPLIVRPREPHPGQRLPNILRGAVTAKLLTKTGVELPDSVFETSDGLKTQELDSDLSAKFSIRIVDSSEGNTFKLVFIVRYEVDGYGECEDRVTSHTFTMYSTRRKNFSAQSQVIAMKPREGPSLTPTEVWIKGKGFTEDIAVLFGEHSATVTEVVENLITVQSPTRPDLADDTTVDVSISNKIQNDLLQGNKLQFLYRVKPKPPEFPRREGGKEETTRRLEGDEEKQHEHHGSLTED
eukprot:TRINITY_DN1298_c0_g1_i1.p1 TRINITY_DN1298_c0_g1~~TRINITY_DN1298_c0_g1_i1.p1  ORF type:complete len:525 (-),score=108.87 TRINITY_DN1298_c0_g1_i1:318-1892(-)